MPATIHNAPIASGYAGDLVAITAQATINPGETIDLPADALRNGLGDVVQIDAFRWCADAQEATATSAVTPTVNVGLPGAAVSCALQFGDKPLTGQAVPLYCLGFSQGQDVESAILGVADGVNTMFKLGALASGVWAFDRPMSMQPRSTISARFTHNGLLNLPIKITIALTGRMAPNLPMSRWLPYAAAWVPPAFKPSAPTATAPVTVSSTERDLVSRVSKPLYVSRFAGRIMRIGVADVPDGVNGVRVNADWVFPPVQAAYTGKPITNFFPGAVDSFLTVTMRDSRGNDNIPFALPFRQVFAPERRAWECPHVLDPQGYYIATLSLAVPAVATDMSIQPSIAFVGSWEGA